MNDTRNAAAAVGFGGKPPPPAIGVRFQPFRNQAGTMLGWLRLESPSGLIIDEAKLMVGSKGKRWVAVPSVLQVHADGTPRLVDGKKAWRPVLEFKSPEVREKFEGQVLAALRASHPASFQGEPEP